MLLFYGQGKSIASGDRDRGGGGGGGLMKGRGRKKEGTNGGWREGMSWFLRVESRGFFFWELADPSIYGEGCDVVEVAVVRGMRDLGSRPGISFGRGVKLVLLVWNQWKWYIGVLCTNEVREYTVSCVLPSENITKGNDKSVFWL